MEVRRLLQNYKAGDLFSVSVLLTPPNLNQLPFYTSSALSVSFCWLTPTTVLHSSFSPRLGSANAPCPSNLLIHICGDSWVTDSFRGSVDHYSLIMASQWVSAFHITFALYLLPSTVQVGMLIWGQRSFSPIAPGKGGPGWKHGEVQSPVGSPHYCYWLYRKSWWEAYCWLLNFLWSWVMAIIPWLVSRRISLVMIMMMMITCTYPSGRL